MNFRNTVANGLRYFGSLIDSTNPVERWKRPLERLTINPIAEEVSLSDWKLLCSDSRKLYANLGPVRAQIDDKAMYSVGRAWLPVFEGEDRAWGEEARRYLIDEFYPSADVRGYDFQTHLHLLSVGIDRDGDAFPLLTEHSEGTPAVAIISAPRITQEDDGEGRVKDGPYKGLQISHGVIMNASGRPVAFRLDDGSELSARDLVQLMEPQFPDQVRGFPGMTHALLDLRDLRTVQGYEKMACALASSIGLMEFNETGIADRDDPKNLAAGNAASAVDPTIKTFEGGLIRYFKANSGSKIENLKNDRPGDAWQAFMNRLIRNSCAGFGWPYELTWDSSQLGSANVRLILAKAMRAVEDRQSLLRPYAKRAVGYAIAKAIKNGRLKPSNDWWRWGFTMPARMTIDFGRDAAAQREDYAKNIINLSDILGEQGKDLESHIATRKDEDERLISNGVMDFATRTGMATAITTAIGSGALTRSPEVENRLRQLLALPPLTGEQPAPTPPVDGLPQ